MQATDLFLGLLGSKSAGTSESFPRKAETIPSSGGNAFSAEFAKALDRADKSKILAKLDRMRNDAGRQRGADAAKSDAADAKTTSKIDAQATNGSSKVSEACESEKSDNQADRAISAQAAEKQADNSQPEADDAADSKVQETTSTTGQADETEGENDETGSVSDINAKLQALADKLEKELQSDSVAEDEKALAELMAALLAFFMSEAKLQDGIAPENGEASSVSLELNLDADSKLAALLEVLSGDGTAADEKTLQGASVLLKLTDDKGILIPLTNLNRLENGEAAEASAATDSSKSLKIGLEFSSEDLKSAKLVDLTAETKDSELSLSVPKDLIVQASGQDSIDVLIAKLQQGAADEKMSKLLQALGMTEKELTQALTQNNSRTDQITVSVPKENLKPANESGLAMAVSTVSSEFISSDSYLKSLELKALMKEAVSETKERFDVYRKIGELLDAQGESPDTLAKMLETKVAGIMDTSFFKDIESGQPSETKANWTSILAKDSQTGVTQQSNHVAQDGSDRIVFMGRTEKGGLSFGQVLQKLDVPASRANSGQDVSETVMKQLIQRASYSFANGNQGEVRVMLRPEALGDISLKVRMEHDVVIAKITAGSHEVKAIIESNLGQLKSALQEQGVNVGKFDVGVDTGSQQNAQQGAHERANDMYSSGYTGAGSAEDVVGGELPELFDGDYSYDRGGAAGSSSSQLSYLA